jgi:hypothetical protein
MKTIFTLKTAATALVVAAVVSLVNFNDADHAPSDLATSKMTVQKPSTNIVVAAVTNGYLLQQLQRSILVRTNRGIVYEGGPVAANKKTTTKAVQSKMKALG